MLYCDLCGAENSDDATTCVFCDQPLSLAIPHSTNPNSGVASLAPGTYLQGRYSIVEELGQGGFGSVYKALDTQQQNRTVAIKSVHLDGLTSQEMIEVTASFNNEVYVLRTLHHPGLPRLYDHFSDAHNWYLVMDFIEGQTLEAYLTNHTPASLADKNTIRELLHVFIELCDVLSYMHKQHPAVIFRDLKPANVMISANKQISLIDFGIARHFKPGKAHDTIAFGSPGYASPEQYGKAQTTPQSDIYSLGAIMHQALTALDPSQAQFRFAPIRPLNPLVPEEMEELIAQMLELDASRRPQKVDSVKTRLEHFENLFASGKVYGYTGSSAKPGVKKGKGQKHNPAAKQQQVQAQKGARKASARVGKPGITRRNALLGAVVALATFGTLWEANTRFGQTNTKQTSTDSEGADLQNTRLDATINAPGGPIVRIAAPLSDTGLPIAFACDRTIYTWDGKDGSAMPGHPTPHAQSITALCWSPGADILFSASQDLTIALTSMKESSSSARYRLPSLPYTIDWSPRHDLLAVGCADGQIYLFTTSLKLINIIPAHTKAIRSLAWSPYDLRLATGGEDYMVKVWDWDGATLSQARIYKGHGDTVTSLAWSDGATSLASASLDHTAQVWSLDRGEQTPIIYNQASRPDYDVTPAPLAQQKPSVPLTALAWQRQNGGKFLAATGQDGSIHVWNANTGQPHSRVQSPSLSLNGIAWIPDDDETATFIVGGQSRSAYRYRLE